MKKNNEKPAAGRANLTGYLNIYVGFNISKEFSKKITGFNLICGPGLESQGGCKIVLKSETPLPSKSLE